MCLCFSNRVVLVALSLWFAISLSVNIYNSWQEDPVLTSVSTTGYSIQEMEYPSITICAQGAVNEVVGEVFEILLFMIIGGIDATKPRAMLE